jgi:pimeloyl-ACP methyl ester carboxylesterase
MRPDGTAIERHLVTVGGTQVEYLVAGEGPEVVLLHGLGDSADDWRDVMTHLSRSYRVYAPTLPGFGGDRRAVGHPGDEGADGQSPGSLHHAVEDPSPESFARFCNAFVDAKQIRHPILGGHSLGGLIALLATLDRPDRVRGLVLIASAGLGREITPVLQVAGLPIIGDISAQASRLWPGAALRAMSRASLLFGRPWRTPRSWLDDQYRRAQDGRFMEATLRALRLQVHAGGQRHVILNRLSAVSQPTLVVWGTADRVVPVSHARSAIARLPDGHLEIINGLGHVPHVEDPRLVASVISRFLSTLS